MTAHMNHVSSIVANDNTTRSFWTTVLRFMPAVESKHYGDVVELRDYVICEMGRLNILGRYNPNRGRSMRSARRLGARTHLVTTARVGSWSGRHKRTAVVPLNVYLYNQAVCIVKHRAQDLARINTFEIEDDQGSIVRKAYVMHGIELPSHDRDELESNNVSYGDVEGNWESSCNWSCIHPERTDSKASLDTLMSILGQKERTVATALTYTGGSIREALSILNSGEKSGKYNKVNIATVVSSIRNKIERHAERDSMIPGVHSARRAVANSSKCEAVLAD